MLMTLSMATWAATYPIYIGGVQVTDDNKNNINPSGKTAGTITFSGSSLTFTGVTMSYSGKCISYTGTDPLTIRFSGTNTLTTTGTAEHCIYAEGPITLDGIDWNKPASLTVNAQNIPSDYGFVPIYANFSGTMNIWNLYLTANGSGTGAIVGKMGLSTYISTSCSEVSAKCASGNPAVYRFKSWGMSDNGKLMDDNVFNTSTNQTETSSGSKANNITLKNGLYIGRCMPRVASSSSYNYSPEGKTAGTISYYNGKLTLNGVTFSTSSHAIVNYNVPNLNIETIGECNITSTSGDGCRPYANTTFTGSGTLMLTSKTESAISTYRNANVTIKMKEIQALGADRGFYGQNDGELILNKYSDDCIYKFAGANKNVYTGKLTMNDMDISTSHSYWNASDGNTYYEGSVAKGSSIGWGTWFMPTSAISYYAIEVGGTRIKTNCTNYIYSPYITGGKVTYDNSSKTLTLDGVTMDVTKDNISCIYTGSALGDLNIKLVGENNLKANSTAVGVNNNLVTFTGTGNMTMTSRNSHGLSGMGSHNKLTIENSSYFLVDAAGRAIYGNFSEVILKKATSDTYGYRFTTTGSGDAIWNIKKLTLDNMDFYASDNDATYSAGCYFDESANAVKQNGGATAKKVSFHSIKEALPIYVAGKQLNTVYNFGGANDIIEVGSPYIKAGGGKAVCYNPKTKTLTLNGATIEAPEGAYGIQTDGLDDLVISTTDDNNITTSDKATLRLGGNTTITGTGKFTVTSTEDAAIDMRSGASGQDTGLKLQRSGGEFVAVGKTYGYYGYQTTALDIVKEGSGCKHKFSGKEGDIHNTKLTMGEGVGINTRYHWFNEDKYCMYNKDAEAKSTDIGNATWILSDVTWEKLPIWIAGTQLEVNDFNGGMGNVSGFCNKYYQGTGISYDKDTKTLTLNNVTMDVSGLSDNAIWNKGVDGMTIEVSGDCELRKDDNTGWSSMNIWGNTTIKGSGTLKLPGKEGDIYASGCTVTLDDISVDAEGDIYGSSGAKLVVSLSDNEKTVKAAKGISSWSGGIELENGAAVVAPSGAVIDGGTVKVGGSTAMNVVIQRQAKGYNLQIAGVDVTEDNCGDILGNGVFKYDEATNTLTINGDYNYDASSAMIKNYIEGLTINVAGESTLSISTSYFIIYSEKDFTITGGKLTLKGNSGSTAGGIKAYGGNLTITDATIEVTGDIYQGINGYNSVKTLTIQNSDIVISAYNYGCMEDWSSITLNGCYISEPRPSKIVDGAVCDENDHVMGTSTTPESVVIVKGTDAVDGIEMAEAPTEVYDVAGRKLNEPGRGINIVRSGDKTVKILKK